MTTIHLQLGDLGKYEQRLGRSLRTVIRKAEQKAAVAMVDVVRHGTLEARPASPGGQKGAVYKGRFLRAWRGDVRGTNLHLRNSTPHAAFVEFGRKPGKPPPVSALIPWVRAKITKGAMLRGAGGRFISSVRPIAYLIARAIGRRGLLGREVMRTARTKLIGIFAFNILNALDRAMRETPAT